MKLVAISIKNYRSIIRIDDATIAPFQAILGENNTGKSNILDALDVFLSAGSGGVSETDFYDSGQRIVIKAKFKVESSHLKRIWKPYTINDTLTLEKHIWLDLDTETGKKALKNEFHGYKAEPRDWFLSLEKIETQEGARPNWKQIVTNNRLPEYFLNNSNCSKADFKKGLDKYLQENEIVYDQPDLSATQALGLQSYVVSSLPKIYVLKAETQYRDETDKRSSSTTFRRLMGDLTDRIIKKDPRYQKIEAALKLVTDLLNEQPMSETPQEGTVNEARLTSLATIEEKIKVLLVNLMPSVEKIKLKVLTDDVKTIFSKGVEITVNDGVETEVLLKGHGLQRCILFALLQALILNERRELVDGDEVATVQNPIILAIEEPELYIHPQLGKLFYDALTVFAENDQVIFTTHSPRFIDVYKYDSIAIVTKSKPTGTKYINCDVTAFEGLADKKVFQGLTQLNSDVNELFFAKKVLVVEGPEDKIAVTETCKKLGVVSTRLEEVEVTAISAGGKQSIQFFVRVLNAFKIKYVVLHDLDIIESMGADDKATEEKRNQTIKSLAGDFVVNFPIKLENTVGVERGHFKDQYDALRFFTDHDKINPELENIINTVITKLGASSFANRPQIAAVNSTA